MLLAAEGMDGVARASKRTDVYALGIIAHEVTENDLPWVIITNMYLVDPPFDPP